MSSDATVFCLNTYRATRQRYKLSEPEVRAEAASQNAPLHIVPVSQLKVRPYVDEHGNER